MHLSSSVLSAPSSLLISGFIVGSYGSLHSEGKVEQVEYRVINGTSEMGLLIYVKSNIASGHVLWTHLGVRPQAHDDGVIRARIKAALLTTCASCGIVLECVSPLYGGSVSGETIFIYSLSRFNVIKMAIGLMGLDLSCLGYKPVLPNFLIPLLYFGLLTA